MSEFQLVTERLILRHFSVDDIGFIQAHYNEASFIESIGDKNIHSAQDAITYLEQGPFKNYQERGFGLFIVTLKDSGQAIGTCGLIARDNIDDIDIGYSLRESHRAQGYLGEAAAAVLEYARDVLKLVQVVAYTSPQNTASIKALQKLDFVSAGEYDLPGSEQSSKYFIRSFR